MSEGGSRGKGLLGLIRLGLVLAGLLLATQVAMALFGLPAAWVTWMTARDAVLTEAPEVVVVLGGGGIPSESGLMRTYHAAELAGEFREARFVVSLPADGDPETSSVGRMRDELVMRGVDAGAIEMEYRARNTHEQAVALRRMLGPSSLDRPLLIVTSPSHGRRALMCFRKEGFRNVACTVAQGTGAEADLGGHLTVRYGFWSALETEIRYARELVALLFYRLRGWA